MSELESELNDGHGYPTDEGLRLLRQFTGSPAQLVDILSRTFGRMGSVWTERKEANGNPYPPYIEVNLATGGWSGNESMIVALKDTFFWFAYWEQSRRGGGYRFNVRVEKWDEPMPSWPLAVQDD